MGRRWGPPFASLILVSPLCGTIRKASGLHPWKGQGWAAALGAGIRNPGSGSHSCGRGKKHHLGWHIRT